MEDLTRRINASEFDSALPPDGELMEYYGVSRHTVRDAVRKLHEQGIVSRSRGRETQLRPDLIEPDPGVAESLFHSAEAMGSELRSLVRRLETRTAPEIAERLEVPPTAMIVNVERVRLVDDAAVALDSVWMPASIARPLLDVDFSQASVNSELQRLCGVKADAGVERLQPVVASPADATVLDVVEGAPLLLVERLTTLAGLPIQFGTTLFRSDRLTHTMAWERSPAGSDVRTDVRFAP